jgi:hypothetical protein
MFFHPGTEQEGWGRGAGTREHIKMEEQHNMFLKWSKIRKLGNTPGIHQIELKRSKIMYSVDNSPVTGKVIGETLFQN